MTNRLALYIALLLAGLVAADLYVSDGAALLFLGRKLFVLLDWLAFWR